MDDLEKVETDAVVIDPPSTEDNQESEKLETVEDKELTDEELKEEIARLSEEVKNEEDAKEKRHKEQDIGWKMKIIKEREKAKSEAEKAKKLEESRKDLEKTLIEEAYSKAIDDNFGLPYFENLYKTNPEFANKLSKEKWGKSAKDIILDTKRQMAQNGDEDLQKYVSEEDIRTAERSKVYHEIAIEQAQELFESLEDSQRAEAQEYFDEIVEGKTLTPTKAKKYAEMAVFYATRNNKTEPEKKPIDKDRILAEKASTGITSSFGSKTDGEKIDIKAVRQSLLNAGISQYQVDLMYPL